MGRSQRLIHQQAQIAVLQGLRESIEGLARFQIALHPAQAGGDGQLIVIEPGIRERIGVQ